MFLAQIRFKTAIFPCFMFVTSAKNNSAVASDYQTIEDIAFCSWGTSEKGKLKGRTSVRCSIGFCK